VISALPMPLQRKDGFVNACAAANVFVLAVAKGRPFEGGCPPGWACDVNAAPGKGNGKGEADFDQEQANERINAACRKAERIPNTHTPRSRNHTNRRRRVQQYGTTAVKRVPLFLHLAR
jgi:hypothetical protein